MEDLSASSAKIRVLVVDDEAIGRHLLCRLLELSGFVTAGAANGERALAMVQEFQPQAILMDLRMPVLNGIAATQRLKSNNPTCNIPVLILTGSSSPEERRQAEAAGAAAFLSKPLNLDQLLLQLRRHAFAGTSSRPVYVSRTQSTCRTVASTREM